MNYIDEMLNEGNLLNDIAALFGKAGWTMERYFKRTAFARSLISQQPTPQEQSTHEVVIAEHMILQHPTEKLFYGFAVAGGFELPYSTIPIPVRPLTSVSAVENSELNATQYRSSNNYKDFAEWATNKWPPYKQKHTLYMYMVEKVHSEFENNEDSVVAWESNDLLRAALDLDVIETGMQKIGNNPVLQVFHAKDAKRSPAATVRFRIPKLETITNDYGFGTPTSLSNWHNDSKIEVRGLLDEDKAMLILEGDTSAAFENNATPTIPLYIGKFDSLDPQDEYNFCLTAGSAFPSDTPELDYDDKAPMNKEINPLLQTYPANPSNGVDNIMVYRGRKGAYYQKHMLFVETVPNAQEPARTHNKRDYVRAWQQAESEVSKYQFNPSSYDDKVKTSYAYFAHTDEGLRGKLSDIIVSNPISIVDFTTLKHRQSTCPTVYDEYTAFNTGAVSPFTKIPGTPYHSLAIGILTKKGSEQ